MLNNILHVEDDEDIRSIALMALQTIGGFNVVQCSSGQDAVKKVQEFTPDLFLLDVMMPGMSGIETQEALRKMPRFADTPVIFMTAKAHREEIDAFKGSGAIDVITKPFDPVTLSDQVRAAWDKHK